jgi:hypothetical protein
LIWLDPSRLAARQVRSRRQILVIRGPDHRNPVTAFHHAGGEPEDALNDQVRS